MSASIKKPMAVAFTLAVSLFALPALGATAHDNGHKLAQRGAPDFGETTAYVSATTPVAHGGETDGLGRKDEECNMGCVDH